MGGRGSALKAPKSSPNMIKSSGITNYNSTRGESGARGNSARNKARTGGRRMSINGN